MTANEWAGLIGTCLATFGAVWHKLNASLGSSKDGSLKDAVLRLEGKIDARAEDISSVRREVVSIRDEQNHLIVRVQELEDRANGS